MKKLLPILLLVLGIGAGVGAGFALRPAPLQNATSDTTLDPSHDSVPVIKAASAPSKGQVYIPLTDQFVIPVVEGKLVKSLILATLTIEAKSGSREFIFEREPKLRDALLQVMFDHANAGGFDGAFTNSSKLDRLRETFVQVSQMLYGDVVTDVLIVEITRQDL